MTQRIDLMPESSRQRLRQRRASRRWVKAYAGSVALIVSATLSSKLVCRPSAQEFAALDARIKLGKERAAEVARLSREIDQLQAEIDQHDRIAWPVRISNVIDVIGQVAPESITLTRLSVTPQFGRDETRSPVPGLVANRPGSTLLIELHGVAEDDAYVAGFVAGLEAHPLFDSPALDYAQSNGAAKGQGGGGRKFGLTCQIDMNNRYMFARAGAREGR